MTITVLTQPNCAACKWVTKSLDAEGLPYELRDVRQDPSAEDLLVGIYQRLRPGMHPQTPVTILGDEGVVFGPDIRSRLRELRQDTAA
ncbi:glutaredoxin family protein [Mycobacteroides abscessus]|uniref:glutaredoxin family protein n=1 Tax=Mycobacteroides abscessus TaxID=36809 RepID=UPI000C25DF1E|nr:glutaredoxin family protein [Mycobacteroides abscessus]